jgi:hypothetical protein
MRSVQFKFKLFALSTVLAASSVAFAQVPDRLEDEAGVPLLKDYVQDGELIGQYWQYLPAGTSADYAVAKPVGSDPLTIIVLVHGTTQTDALALGTSETFLNRYITDADTQWFAVIAPVFNNTDFNGSANLAGASDSYRTLIGRHRDGVEPRKTDADGLINGILNEYKHKHPEIINNKALFYGHSAGGQCLSRYIVTHTGRVAAAVISAPSTYASPDPSISWPGGMGDVTKTISWPGVSDRTLEFEPAESLFLRAANLPITVMVGANDTDTRRNRGATWVSDMRSYAGLGPGDPGVSYASPPGVDHSSAQTQPLALPKLMNNEPPEFYIEWLGSTMGPVMMN